MDPSNPDIRQMVEALWEAALADFNEGRLHRAGDGLDRLLTLAPDLHEAWNKRSIVAYRLKRPAEAADFIRRARALAPDRADYCSNLCEYLRLAGDLAGAEESGYRAVVLDPNNAAAQYNLAMLLAEWLDLTPAIACLRHALALEPANAGAHFELAEALLIKGEWEEGWREYEWRYDMPGAAAPLPDHRRHPQWSGARLDGTLLLVCDQGFGDAIQFCRYIEPASKRCARLVVVCGPEILPVVAQQPGIARLVTRWDEIDGFDAWCPLSGLPRRFATTPATIPGRMPYLAPDARKVEHWRRRLDMLAPKDDRRIGLVWAGRPSHGNDANRSMRLDQLAPLAALPRTVLVSLQMGPARQQIGGYSGAAPLIDLGAEIADFSDTAAILANLERLVTVDSAPAHLAGALGRPVSILLPYAPDWRWLLGRADTPWYPSARLYRQPALRAWAPAVAALARDLAAGISEGPVSAAW